MWELIVACRNEIGIDWGISPLAQLERAMSEYGKSGRGGCSNGVIGVEASFVYWL